MRVTINGIIYEGTPSEIRDIVENPPKSPRKTIADRKTDCPDNDGWDDTPYPPVYPKYPASPYDITWTYYGRNWDGSPTMTCCVPLEDIG